MDTPPRSFPITGLWNMHFRRLWNGMFDCHRAEITVMQFTGHSLPVHHFVAEGWDFYLVPYCQPSSPTRSLPITGHRNMHFRRLWNGMFDRHRAEITVMQFTGHSLLVHHFVTAWWDFYLVPYCQPSCILHNLSKIFNKNTVKLSYSCMPNISTLISGGHSKSLREIKMLTPPPIITVLRRKTAPSRKDVK